MFLNIMDDNQQQKIGGITPEYPLLVEWHNMNALDVPWHWHEEVECVFVAEGSCTFLIGAERCTLRAGDGVQAQRCAVAVGQTLLPLCSERTPEPHRPGGAPPPKWSQGMLGAPGRDGEARMRTARLCC